MSEQAGRVADATGNWVDGLAPAAARPYLRLARLDRPIGAWLLLIPCWWSVGLAGMRADHFPSLWHIVLFFIGAFAMRGAGCTWNDLVDRNLDKMVERTRSRPIPSGQVSAVQATIFMVAQALVGFVVLIQFNRFTGLTGLASLLVVVIYPFMKRITYWPQIVLGLAFSWGALMGWPAAFGRLDWPALILYAGSICWVIGYDTIYAHQDREDDLLIGIKSTALLFQENTPTMLAGFYAGAVVLIGSAGLMAGGGAIFVLGLIAFAAHLAWQVLRLNINDPAHCLMLFGAMLLDAVF
jgi:4-hydroxybenzoate polyprenyltransferase